MKDRLPLLDPRVPGSLRTPLSRRSFLRSGGSVAAVAGLDRLMPTYLRAGGSMHRGAPDVLAGGGAPIELVIAETEVSIEGRRARATTINGTVPGPLLRFRQGDEAEIHVTNRLDEDTSIHWHGILLPNAMDGVPGVTFRGIPAGETFVYRFAIRQYGTYWYHSHSGFQEQLGHYGPLVIDPVAGEPRPFDREHVVVFSDWTFEDPQRVFARLRKDPGYYNHQRRSVFDFFRDAARDGFGPAVRDRLEWAGMRMDPTDLSDITGATYTYLVNGQGPAEPWAGLFQPGERVRLRLINASAASILDVRIPGLPMTVMQVSGQHVRPVETDEIRVAIAETYDVIVEPTEDRAYTIVAEAIDRSGYARATLAPREGAEAPIPPRRPRPLLTMADMGMAHDMAGMEMDMPTGEPTTVSDMPAAPAGDDPHAGHVMPEQASGAAPMFRPPGAVPPEVMHGPDTHGVANASVPMSTKSRLHEPGVGLGQDGWRVLTYADLDALETRGDLAPPDRELELHLTGNMERYQWSIDGVRSADAEAIHVGFGERIRLTLVNDTMMHHPMHLHGMWMELENGKGNRIPLVHTVNVKPAERISVLFTADAPGPWAFHCHVLYHMEAGMFRVFHVMEPGA